MQKPSLTKSTTWANTLLKALVPLAVLILPFFADPCIAQELLRNPGFEGPVINGIATGWKDNSGWAEVDIDYSVDEEGVGIKAQRILCKRFTSGAVQFVQQGVSLEKGRGYRITIRARGKLNGPLEIMLRKKGAPYTVYARKAVRIGEQWQDHEFTLTSGVHDPDVYFMVRLTGTGEIWLDRVSLQKTAAVKHATRPPDPHNLIANSSFETGLDRWAVKVREANRYRYEMTVEFADSRPEIITGKVPHGDRAMYIDVPKHGRVIITTPAVQVTPGYTYSLSLWLKSEQTRKVHVALNSMGAGARVSRRESFVVGPQWQRYQLPLTIPITGEGQHYLIMESSGQGGLFVDGVQLIAGNNVNFRPRQPLEIGITRQPGAPLFYRHYPADLEFCLAVHEALGGAYTVRVISTDFYGKETELFEQQFSFDKAKNLCRSFSHPTDRTGYFRIRAEVRHKKDNIDQATMAIGVAPKVVVQQGVASPFGGHARFNPSSLKAIKMLGVSWLRMHPPLGTKWFIVEPEKNRFEFIDEPILFAKEQGFHILGSLDSTPRWASSAPKDLKTEQMGGFRSYMPNEMSDWENYVSRIVAHYRGVIDHWEIWNEPDRGDFLKVVGPNNERRKSQIYARLVKSAYQAAKKANPEAVIVSGVGTAKPPGRWVGKLIDRGILDYLDVLSFHFYTDGRPGDALDVTAGERVAELRSLMKAGGREEIPIWESESGYALEACGFETAGDEGLYCASPEESVAFVIRNYMEWIGSGVERWFFYHMFFPDRTDRTRLSGFFDWDRSPKPLALGYATLSWALQGTSFKQLLPEVEGIAGSIFTGDSRRVRIFWVKDWSAGMKKTLSISCNIDIRQTMVIDAMGNQIAECPSSGRFEIGITRVPVFVVDVMSK